MVVVVLGHELRSESIHPELRGRVDAGIGVFQSTDTSYLIFSGGISTPVVPTPECEVMREYATDRGVDPTRILLETRAEDTIGNGYFTRRLVDDMREPVDTIYLVSSCYHMERAEYVFRQCFGDEYDIDAGNCHRTDAGDDRQGNHEKLVRLREFFDPIDPGDVTAIRRRLAEAHDYYPELEEPSAPL